LIIAVPQIGKAAKNLAENAGSFIFSTGGSMTLLGYEGYHNNARR
jgi:hypothetical protein